MTLFATSASYFTIASPCQNVSTPPRIVPFQPLNWPGLADLPFVAPSRCCTAPSRSWRSRFRRRGAFFRTPLGLAARGREEPAAVEAQGLDVHRIRIGAVVAGSALMALGGAFLAMSAFNAFFFEMTGGRGWICIAHGLRLLAARQGAGRPLLFGAFDALRLDSRRRSAAPCRARSS